MAELTRLGYTQATDLADVIMMSAGVPYESAHRVVGQVIALAIERGIPSNQISVQLVDEAAQDILDRCLHLEKDVLNDALDCSSIVRTRTGPGGAAVAPMEKMIADCRNQLGVTRLWLAGRKVCMAEAEAALLREVHRLC